MSVPDLSFTHRFVPAVDPEAPPLLLLHGTGGDEDEMLPHGRHVSPGSALLSPRGPVLERGLARFFQRFEAGVFDLEDLERRTHDLAAFIREAASLYRFDLGRLVAVGYSNGANIAASLLLRHPDVLRHAVLWHAQVPFEPDVRPDLRAHQVLMTAGRRDPIVPPTRTERLCDLLVECGAAVQLSWSDAGHALSDGDTDAARRWLREILHPAGGG